MTNSKTDIEECIMIIDHATFDRQKLKKKQLMLEELEELMWKNPAGAVERIREYNNKIYVDSKIEDRKFYYYINHKKNKDHRHDEDVVKMIKDYKDIKFNDPNELSDTGIYKESLRNLITS